MIFPSKITAGITLDVDVALTAYPATDWTLTAYIKGPQAITLTAVKTGSLHTFSATAAVTATWTAGDYWYSIRATDGTDIVEIESSTLAIGDDLGASLTSYDGRKHAERVLEAIEAVIEGRATSDQQSYKINNREIVRIPIADLLRWRDKYRAEVSMIKSAATLGGGLGQRVNVRFTK